MPTGKPAKATPVKKKAPAKKVVKKQIPKEELVVTDAAPYIENKVPETLPTPIDPSTVMITKMQEMMEAIIEQNKKLTETIADMNKPGQSVSEEAKVNNIYTPLKSKLFYRIQFYDYDAEGNKIIRNPMYEYKDFESMEELLEYADENNLGPMNGRWGYIPNRVPMPDEYWAQLEKNN